MNCKPEEECMRNLEALYDEFKAIGALKYTPESYKKYNNLSKQMFPLLKSEYLNSSEKEKEIEDILNALYEEAADPLRFWGSEKIAAKVRSYIPCGSRISCYSNVSDRN